MSLILYIFTKYFRTFGIAFYTHKILCLSSIHTFLYKEKMSFVIEIHDYISVQGGYSNLMASFNELTSNKLTLSMVTDS